MKILVIEDEDAIASRLERGLQGAGYVVERAADGEDALFRATEEDFAAIVLDLGLPVLDGLSLLRRLRAAGRATPVLVVSARGSWSERVEGIDAGADDYLGKPFRMEEVVARVRALVRRAHGHFHPVLSVHGIDLDTRTRTVTVDGGAVALTASEYRLLHLLMQNAGRVMSRQELADQLYAEHEERESNTLEVLIGRLRRKVGDEAIRTRRGQGYVIETESGQA
ncbi:MAG TPA: response regulator transcription factor [Geminicoccus sp.]|uniref:response regulator transcription factor n=1 Tax=Geminicoccus sp. TaxID=2024832 RepID=UPI002E35C944|nr:response regulator transcription factor [Geminicoccus sp.]HEX2529303.1 response regulator transcription factor [Geminicoccus sp.]